MRLSPFVLLDGLFAPAPAPRRIAFLVISPFAHLGLKGPGVTGASRAAIEAAIAAGHGIQCAVQANRSGDAIIVDDGASLAGLLGIVAARVPILIDLKVADGIVAPLCLAVRRALEGYRGPVAVMSANPAVPHWFAAHAERIVRGLAVRQAGRPGLRGRIRRRAAFWRGRPDFLACDRRDLPSRFAGAARGRGLPVLTWTMRDAAAERAARTHADQIIYEQAA